MAHGIAPNRETAGTSDQASQAWPERCGSTHGLLRTARLTQEAHRLSQIPLETQTRECFKTRPEEELTAAPPFVNLPQQKRCVGSRDGAGGLCVAPAAQRSETREGSPEKPTTKRRPKGILFPTERGSSSANMRDMRIQERIPSAHRNLGGVCPGRIPPGVEATVHGSREFWPANPMGGGGG